MLKKPARQTHADNPTGSGQRLYPNLQTPKSPYLQHLKDLTTNLRRVLVGVRLQPAPIVPLALHQTIADGSLSFVPWPDLPAKDRHRLAAQSLTGTVPSDEELSKIQFLAVIDIQSVGRGHRPNLKDHPPVLA